MNKFKKDLVCNITLICVLAFSLVHLVLLTLNLFNVFSFALPTNFSYFTAYFLMILCFSLYIFGFWITKFKSLKIPTWFRMVFYIAFFIFTNVYYILGLYSILVFMIIFVAYLAFILNIIALSLHFYLCKDEKNKLKTTTYGLVINLLAYSISLCGIAIFLISLFKVLILKNFIFTTLTSFIIEMSVMLVICIATAITFGISHKKSKKIINKCLIKTIPRTISPSVKSA